MAEEEKTDAPPAECGGDAPAEPDAAPADAAPAEEAADAAPTEDAAPVEQAATGEEAQEEEWALKEEATRIFNLADNSNDGVLNVDELTSMTGVGAMAERMLGSSDADLSGSISLDEWLAYIKKKGDRAEMALQLYENVLAKQAAEAWAPVKAEATRIFNLADHSKDGSLNLDELTALTGFEVMAERMLGSSGADLSGSVSLDEWLAYIKLKGGKGTKALQLYENMLTRAEEVAWEATQKAEVVEPKVETEETHAFVSSRSARGVLKRAVLLGYVTLAADSVGVSEDGEALYGGDMSDGIATMRRNYNSAPEIFKCC